MHGLGHCPNIYKGTSHNQKISFFFFFWSSHGEKVLFVHHCCKGLADISVGLLSFSPKADTAAEVQPTEALHLGVHVGMYTLVCGRGRQIKPENNIMSKDVHYFFPAIM